MLPSMLNSALAYGHTLLGALLFFVVLAVAARPRFFAAGFLVLVLVLTILGQRCCERSSQIPLSRQHKVLRAAQCGRKACRGVELEQ